jgi:hypothetical protein
MGIRRIAQQRNILTASASQTNRGGADEDITVQNIAEDFRKLGHVTKMVAINCTKEEKKNGIYRIAQLAERDEETVFEQAVVTSCLALGATVLDSRYRSEVWVNKEK